MWEIVAIIVCSIFILAALIGSILPFLPGVPLAWIGLLIYAAVTGFEKISVLTTVIFFIVMLITLAIGYFAPMLGAKKYKTSSLGIFGSFLGLTFGVLLFGPWGIIIGPFIGAVIGELIARKAPEPAVKSAFGTFIGYITGTLLQIIVVLIMAGFFLAALF